MVKYEKVTLTNMKKKAKCEKWKSHILQRTFLKNILFVRTKYFFRIDNRFVQNNCLLNGIAGEPILCEEMMCVIQIEGLLRGKNSPKNYHDCHKNSYVEAWKCQIKQAEIYYIYVLIRMLLISSLFKATCLQCNAR